jgi:cytochrome-b5 reductase
MMDSNEKTEISNTPDDDIYPHKPTKPFDSECCGTGCTPCVFDIYDKQISQWKIQCDAIRKNGVSATASDCNSNSTTTTSFLTPEKYTHLKIIDIFKETENMKIFRFQYQHEFPIKLGQHLLLKEGCVSKPYSILRTDSELCTFDILIKIYSEMVPKEVNDKIQDTMVNLK